MILFLVGFHRNHYVSVRSWPHFSVPVCLLRNKVGGQADMALIIIEILKFPPDHETIYWFMVTVLSHIMGRWMTPFDVTIIPGGFRYNYYPIVVSTLHYSFVRALTSISVTVYFLRNKGVRPEPALGLKSINSNATNQGWFNCIQETPTLGSLADDNRFSLVLWRLWLVHSWKSGISQGHEINLDSWLPRYRTYHGSQDDPIRCHDLTRRFLSQLSLNCNLYNTILMSKLWLALKVKACLLWNKGVRPEPAFWLETLSLRERVSKWALFTFYPRPRNLDYA